VKEGRLEVGGQRLEVKGWRTKVGGWRRGLEEKGWRLEVVGGRLIIPTMDQFYTSESAEREIKGGSWLLHEKMSSQQEPTLKPVPGTARSV